DPVSPSLPSGPVGPVGPGLPAAPVGPPGPVAPGAPCAPVGPGAPSGPVAPDVPWSPSAPAGPAGPVGPGMPAGGPGVRSAPARQTPPTSAPRTSSSNWLALRLVAPSKESSAWKLPSAAVFTTVERTDASPPGGMGVPLSKARTATRMSTPGPRVVVPSTTVVPPTNSKVASKVPEGAGAARGPSNDVAPARGPLRATSTPVPARPTSRPRRVMP